MFIKRIIFRRQEVMALIILTLLFGLGVAVGYAFAAIEPLLAKGVFHGLLQSFKGLLSLSGWRLAVGIFLNNIRVAITMMLLGAVIPFAPGAMIFINGLIIGLVAQQFLAEHTATVGGFIMSLAPHGIIELPAIFLAAVVGTILGWDNWRLWFDGKPHSGWKSALKHAGVWLIIIGALLIPAALIEVFLTPLFMR